MTIIIRKENQSAGAKFFKNMTGLQSVTKHFFFLHKNIIVLHIYLPTSLSIIHLRVIIFSVPTWEDSQITLPHGASELSGTGRDEEGLGCWLLDHRHVKECRAHMHTHTHTPLSLHKYDGWKFGFHKNLMTECQNLAFYRWACRDRQKRLQNDLLSPMQTPLQSGSLLGGLVNDGSVNQSQGFENGL